MLYIESELLLMLQRHFQEKDSVAKRQSNYYKIQSYKRTLKSTREILVDHKHLAVVLSVVKSILTEKFFPQLECELYGMGRSKAAIPNIRKCPVFVGFMVQLFFFTEIFIFLDIYMVLHGITRCVNIWFSTK